MIAPGETKPRLDLGDLGAAHWHAMRRWAIEFDHGAVTLLANEGDMRDRHDMAAVHPDEQSGIELRFGFRDRPWAHPLAVAVIDTGIVGFGAETLDNRVSWKNESSPAVPQTDGTPAPQPPPA